MNSKTSFQRVLLVNKYADFEFPICIVLLRIYFVVVIVVVVYKIYKQVCEIKTLASFQGDFR